MHNKIRELQEEVKELLRIVASLTNEVEALKHDIDAYVIANAMLTDENERLRKLVAVGDAGAKYYQNKLSVKGAPEN